MKISNSRLGMYLRCGEQYRRRYEEKEIIPPGVALIRGSSVHKGAEENNKYKLAQGKDISKKDLVDIAVSEFNKIVRDGVYLTREEKTQKKKIIGEGKDDTAKLTGLFSDEVAPTVQPEKIELPFEIPYDKHFLTGRIDLIIKKGFRELKTSNKKKNQREVDETDQLTIYSLAYEFLFGKPPEKIIMDVLVNTKIVKYEPMETIRTYDDMNLFLRRVNTVFLGIQKGVFLPCNPMDWICSERWCGFYNTCKYRNP